MYKYSSKTAENFCVNGSKKVHSKKYVVQKGYRGDYITYGGWRRCLPNAKCNEAKLEVQMIITQCLVLGDLKLLAGCSEKNRGEFGFPREGLNGV